MELTCRAQISTERIYAARCNWEPRKFARRSLVKARFWTMRCKSWWTLNAATALALRRRRFLRFFCRLFEVAVFYRNIRLNLVPLVNARAIRAYNSNQKWNLNSAHVAIVLIICVLGNRTQGAVHLS